MSQYLRKRERCPIHFSLYCSCHKEVDTRTQSAKKPTGPVRKIDDATNPRGYREVCSPGELRRRKHLAIIKQQNKCWFCHELFTTFLEVDLHHISARKMGGGSRDDHPDNLAAVHSAFSKHECHGKIHAGRTA